MHAEMTTLMMRALDETLGADEERALQAHLQTCADCASEWDALQTVQRQLASAPMLSPADGFADRVLQRIAAQQQAAARRPNIARLLLFGLAVVGVAGVSLAFSPWREFAQPITLAELLSDTLALISTLSTWLNVLLTLARVAAQLIGAGPLVISALLTLGLTIVWTRLVTGSFNRVVLFNGGI